MDRVFQIISGAADPSGGLRMKNGSLIVFTGTTPNIGTTLISFGTAVRLALESQSRIGYLCLNLKSSKLHRYLGRDEVPASLDNLRADLKSKSLCTDKLLQHCDSVRGIPRMSVLYGNMMREQAEFFQPDDIRHLLAAARSAFDVCIVETGAYWDNAGTVCASLDADARYIVTTPDLTHFQEDFQRWFRTTGPLFGMPAGSCRLIVNQIDKPGVAGSIRSREIAKDSGAEVAAEIPRFPDLVQMLNQGKAADLFAAGHPFGRSLLPFARQLMLQCGIQPRSPVKRPWLAKWIPKPIA